MLTIHSEVVDRAEKKSLKELEKCSRLKDSMRMFATKDVVEILSNIVLNNIQQFNQNDSKNTLNIFAQLIDWNELSFFEGII
jgi:hypothetical protein